ncbi:hypothetical protein AXG93_4877s1290 [Marchantia polymorpha subsp. ruderalis]|uniref:Uncharacterized protein n=1 Tax=Marchantia polymorpha subsp. ruderalis TaxID=1480154 RepID=A0A176WCA7_MARPO|nr:hypothetical protein AXG93_4877s1290 [Marchantia polymorpha subsp. ruderalis]
MQQMLESKDLELSKFSKRMKEASSHMAQQEEVVQGLMQQHRTAKLEAQLPALASAHHQSEILMEKVWSLEFLLEKNNENVKNLETILEQKQADMRKAEEAVYAWTGRSEETEAYLRRSQMRISELEA